MRLRKNISSALNSFRPKNFYYALNFLTLESFSNILSVKNKMNENNSITQVAVEEILGTKKAIKSIKQSVDIAITEKTEILFIK